MSIRGVCPTETASGIWPASTIAGGRPAPTGSTAWKSPLLSWASRAPSPALPGRPGRRRRRGCSATSTRSSPSAWSTPYRPRGGAGPRAPPWLLGREPEIVAELLVDAIQAEWAAAAVGEAAVVERRADGGVVLKVAVTNRDAFRSFVLGFLDHAEVLGPPDLRRQLVVWLEALASASDRPTRVREPR